MKKTRTWKTWSSMRERCLNPNHPSFGRYGGRGIKICRRWEKFETFLEDMGERPLGMSLDRIDNNGNYQPSNCRWATPREQQSNKRSNVNLTFNGETRNLSSWARHIGVNFGTLQKRHAYGWNDDEIIAAPVSKSLRTRGSAHYLTRFSEDDIRAIRASNLPHSQIAKQFMVSKPCITAIKTRRNWRHVS